MSTNGATNGTIEGMTAVDVPHRVFPVRIPARLALPVAVGAAVRVLIAAFAALARGVGLLARGIRNRRQAAALAHLDAHLLADIGLTPFDVRDAASARMWDDPAVLLRARALERRLNRHRVSLGFMPFSDESPDAAPRRPDASYPAY